MLRAGRGRGRAWKAWACSSGSEDEGPGYPQGKHGPCEIRAGRGSACAGQVGKWADVPKATSQLRPEAGRRKTREAEQP